MSRVLFTTALVISSATAALSQDKCVTENDVLKYAKQHRMVETRCFWNTETAGSEEEFQCVRTWVSAERTYFSAEDQFGCFVNLRTHSHSEMKKLYRIKKPQSACGDCG